MHAAAKPKPACTPPGALAPQSTTRAPDSRLRTSIPSASASATSASTSSPARSFIDTLMLIASARRPGSPVCRLHESSGSAYLLVEDQDLTAPELGPVARPSC